MVSNKEKNFISEVIYVNNNEKEIHGFLDDIYNTLEKVFNKFEIVIVNDYSTDNTVQIVKDFASNKKSAVISIVNMSFYQGLEAAMNAGVNLAIGDFVYEFDNVHKDYDDKVVLDIQYKSLKGFDIVSASPKNYNRKSSKLFYKVFNKVANMSYELNTESFRILSRRGINRVQSMSKTIPYRKALYSNCGLKLYNIIYDNNKSYKIEKSKAVNENRKEVASDSLILFTDLAYKVSSGMTILMMLVAIITGLYVVFTFLGSTTPIEGWTTTMLFLSVSFFAVFAIMAVIIKYLSLIVNLIFKKQQYIIESIEKITQ